MTGCAAGNGPETLSAANPLRYVCGMRVLNVQSGDQRVCPNCGKAIVLHRVLRRGS